MNTLVDIAEFVEHILRLDLDTPVRGFDGEELGPSNEQAQGLANRTLWLKKRCEELQTKLKEIGDRKYVASVNKKTGAVTITYEDIGAAAEEHKHQPADIETTSEAGFVSLDERTKWNNKQEKLISGETLKTVLGMSLLGKGNIEINGSDIITSPEFLFVSENEKKSWNNKQDILKTGVNFSTLHGKSLLGAGDVRLTSTDVGADKLGTADKAIIDHVALPDPHQQYLTKDRGSEVFVEKSTVNKPNGFLGLDSKGHIPSDIATLYEARYEIVDDKDQRLAIVKSKNLTMALQIDENRIYYLDAEVDPSIDENWKVGRTTDLSDVISIFGRSGIITAEAGDYNADQITETSERLFSSPTEKKVWNGKQDQLVSGKNIRTINGESLIGGSDISITPESIGAAEKSHTHDPNDIKTDDNNQFVTAEEKKRWSSNQAQLVSGETIKTINNEDLLGQGNIKITPESIGAAQKEHTHTPDEIETDDDNSFVSAAEKKKWNEKQNPLKSGVNVKTINDESIVGEGNLSITPEGIGAADKNHKHLPTDIEVDDDHQFISLSEKQLYAAKQTKLVSGKNIATVFGKSLLAGGDIALKDAEGLGDTVNSILTGTDGISISLDEDTGIITIKGPGSDDNGGGGNDGNETTLPKLVIKDVNVISSTATYKYKVGENYNFDFTAYALKEVVAQAAKTDSISYSSSQSNISKTTLPTANSNGYFPAGSASKVSLEYSNTKLEKYLTGPITNPGGSHVLLDLSVEGDSSPVVPTFSSSDPIDGITLFSSTEYPGFVPWKAFQSPLTSDQQKRVENYGYWSDAQIWRNRNTEVYLGVKSDTAMVINAYGFQEFESFYWTRLSTAPVSWRFQGRDKDSDNWVTLDTRTNQNLMVSGSDWAKYALSKPAGYKQYRILVDNVALETARAAIPRMQFYTEPFMLVKSNAGKYYTPNSTGKLVEVDPTGPEIFAGYGVKKTVVPLDIELYSDLFPLRVCALVGGNVTTQFYKNSPQIVLHNPIESTDYWEWLNKLEGKDFYNESDKTDILTAITVDGENYFIIQKGKWISLGKLSNDVTSAQKVIKDGMLFIEMANVTREQWTTILDTVGEKATVGIAYGRLIRNKNDTLTPKVLDVSFDKVSDWMKVSTDVVNVILSKRYITFKTKAKGLYKFCYRFM